MGKTRRSGGDVREALTDEDLVPGAHPESELFARIYSALAPAVLGYFTARGVDDPEALMQDVFLSVLPRVGGITGGVAGLRTFVFSVAHARAVDYYRRIERRPRNVDYDPLLDTRAVPSAEAEALVRNGQTDAHLLIEALKPEQRDVLMLRIVGELSVEDVATVLGKTPGAVKQLQRRGLKALRELVSEGVMA
ncbi:sigma-70 family RNA polymerase sigma factor [Sinomonas sp. JGH33]|uniref:Sigma-70 family RNA polymerase sigma factor n=1 Tax=Sinomonas terricola TaxID=3110330 RepID=A0ABU5T5R2_9MICC|nr:sigma-70 family RNA polymerase sigma factor [Sinomonas sp. JGH33]MEA5455012.1 sigma-70 family RNA polymerase sigma factor [Sinomonas sp. JGH33]